MIQPPTKKQITLKQTKKSHMSRYVPIQFVQFHLRRNYLHHSSASSECSFSIFLFCFVVFFFVSHSCSNQLRNRFALLKSQKSALAQTIRRCGKKSPA